MSSQPSRLRLVARWLGVGGVVLVVIVAGTTFRLWWPAAQSLVQQTIASQRGTAPLDHDDHHEAPGESGEHGHAHGDHESHDEGTSLELSQQAMGNIGLTREFLTPIELETFRRSITVPAIVAERPGRTRIEVSTPMAGVVTHVHAVGGEAVPAGALLFEIRITAKELVATQTELLKTIGELDVENREIARLETVVESGAVPRKTLLERQYAKDKLEVMLAAHKEALRLQGLSERQIDAIVESRRLLRDLQIRAPSPDDHSHEELNLTRREIVPVAYEPGVAPHTEPKQEESLLILQDVLVHKGETVAAGGALAVVADMSELYIEGRAFEQDVDLLMEAAKRGWAVSAMFDRGRQRVEEVTGLEFLYTSSEIDVASRTLRFYVRLPNEIVRQAPSPNGQQFVEWRYRPGQRLQLRIPVEEWERQIVLPVDAIAQEGAEAFVFLQNGKRFDRVSVHVAYRDQAQAVIKNDGSLFPGDVVARRGAHQMQMALKNKAGGGVDPHAGHSH